MSLSILENPDPTPKSRPLVETIVQNIHNFRSGRNNLNLMTSGVGESQDMMEAKVPQSQR